MTIKAFALRAVAVLVWTIAIYGILGGEFIWRDVEPDGGSAVLTLTMYRGWFALPPPSKGPAFCEILSAGSYALAFPCSLRPAFIDLLKAKSG